MNKILLMACLIFGAKITEAQTKVTYYNKKYEVVSEQKARYIKTETTTPNELSVTREVDLKTGKVTQNDTFKGSEPYGIWEVESWSPGKGSYVRQLNYNFPLVYKKDTCNNNKFSGEGFDHSQFKIPEIGNSGDIFQYLAQNVRYPNLAKEEGIQGRVVVTFIVDKQGKVRDAGVYRGVHTVLDKEALRVVREMPFSTPPIWRGEPVEFCFVLPISFRLE